MKFIKKHRILLLQIIFILTFPLLVSLNVLKFIFADRDLHKYFFILLCIIRAFIIVDIIKQILKNYYLNFIKQKQDEKKANKRLLLITSIAVLLICEVIFLFIPQSQKVQKYGLAGYTWNVYYKQPHNEKGFRDEELNKRIDTKNKKVFFLGDSYTYGDGLKYNKDRFTDIIKDHLKKGNIEVFNLGKGNIDTRDEYRNLISFGTKPDILVLQYYLNDIEKVGIKYNHLNMNTTGYAKKKEPKLKKLLIGLCMLPGKVSYFFNYISLNSVKFLPISNHNKYKEGIDASYNDPKCLNEHKKDIQDIIRYCRFYKIKLYVLFVPDLRDIDYSQQMYVSHIVPLLNKNAIPYITIDKELKEYETKQLIVNPLNPHTNEFANKIIAKSLLDSIDEFK